MRGTPPLLNSTCRSQNQNAIIKTSPMQKSNGMYGVFHYYRTLH